MLNCQNNRVIKSHGIIFLEKRESLLKVNITNKNDVVEVLGEPHIRSIHEKNTWIYIERTRTKGGVHKIGKNVLLNNNVLVVKFDRYEFWRKSFSTTKKKRTHINFQKK